MRGDLTRPGLLAATIIDHQGVPKYHIVPTKLIVFGGVSLLLTLLTILILGLMIVSNRHDLDQLRDKIVVEEKEDANTSNTNR